MPKLKQTPSQRLTTAFNVARAEKGYSQKHLAQLFGKTREWVNRVFSGAAKGNREEITNAVNQLIMERESM